jgi:AraC-like DNA-binding protein
MLCAMGIRQALSSGSSRPAGTTKQAGLPGKRHGAGFWHRFEIRRIEDLGNAVFGAELEAVQMAGPPVRGTLAFAARSGVIFSTGLIKGKVSINGPLSKDAITVGVGLRFGLNSRQWLNSVSEGDVGVVLPGDGYDALYTDGSLYVAATLSVRRLKEEAVRAGLVLDHRMTSRTGLHPHPIGRRSLALLSRQIARIHRNGVASDRDSDVSNTLFRTVIEHYARLPVGTNCRVHPVGRARIVSRARDYIREHLADPLSLDAVAEVAGTSRRSLSRAFVEILEDTPGHYIRRLRLHRIRRELVSKAEAAGSISLIAARWGMKEPGRMSGWYRDVFAELPSATVVAGLLNQRRIDDLL